MEGSDCELQETRHSCQKHEKLRLLQRSRDSGDVLLEGRRMEVTGFGPVGTPARMS